MTREEAENILNMAKCGCDGYGVVPGPNGYAIPCPNNCRFITNDELKEARLIVSSEPTKLFRHSCRYH